MADPVRRVLLLDLDGTLCLGDGPALRYAEGVDALLVARGMQPDVFADVLEFVSLPASEHAVRYADSPLRDAQDPWVATLWLARRHGLTPADLEPAFLASRAALERDEFDLHADPELVDLLRHRPPDVRVVLGTNSPDVGMARLLTRLGVDDLLDDVRTSQRKHTPEGMPRLLAHIQREYRVTTNQLLSVGDNWPNDLAPVTAAGGSTAYVDRFGHTELPADLRSDTVAGLVPGIRHWLAGEPASTPSTVKERQ
ncbi:HAD family hydrolase [Flexivirga oryzae]|uniref:FMN phosphatase YigB (HAD superfamily) n=1 Tax=Flexivirga oryzae TaxID=1794944 RepID=A0A839NBP4_9MICO|nr:HAD family hydrolase [Flexivirga oryzae]MBB2892615.1 FMN phosphatase YigB (HAD superfamily) [Flexivirga oryzae]